MADVSAIEWTTSTWNPVAGCTILSPGCINCYAMGDAHRLARNPNPKIAAKYEGTTRLVKGTPVWTGRINLAREDVILQPLRWTRPRLIFVNSMSDLFHESVPDEWIDRIFAVMALCPHHVFQVLTKRSARMRAYCSDEGTPRRIHELVCDLALTLQLNVVLIAPGFDETAAPPGARILLGQWPLPNVWKGVSTEDQPRADERIPDLLVTPAAVRWVSGEPLLGPINFHEYLLGFSAGHPALCVCGHGHGFTRCPNYGGVSHRCHVRECDCTGFRKPLRSDGLHWFVVGGESGSNARDNDFIANARAIMAQCVAAGVPFFGKQNVRKEPLPADLMRREYPATTTMPRIAA